MGTQENFPAENSWSSQRFTYEGARTERKREPAFSSGNATTALQYLGRTRARKGCTEIIRWPPQPATTGAEKGAPARCPAQERIQEGGGAFWADAAWPRCYPCLSCLGLRHKDKGGFFRPVLSCLALSNASAPYPTHPRRSSFLPWGKSPGKPRQWERLPWIDCLW